MVWGQKLEVSEIVQKGKAQHMNEPKVLERGKD